MKHRSKTTTHLTPLLALSEVFVPLLLGPRRSGVCSELSHTVDAVHGISTLCKIARPVSGTTSHVERRTGDLICRRGHEQAIRQVHHVHRPEMLYLLRCAARVGDMNLAAHNFHHRRIRPLVPGSRTTTGHDLVTSQEPARDHFSTDAAARKTNLLRDPRNASRGGRRPDPATGRTVRRLNRNEGRDGG